jgi:hypothetical protein
LLHKTGAIDELSQEGECVEISECIQASYGRILSPTYTTVKLPIAGACADVCGDVIFMILYLFKFSATLCDPCEFSSAASLRSATGYGGKINSPTAVRMAMLLFIMAISQLSMTFVDAAAAKTT